MVVDEEDVEEGSLEGPASEEAPDIFICRKRDVLDIYEIKSEPRCVLLWYHHL